LIREGSSGTGIRYGVDGKGDDAVIKRGGGKGGRRSIGPYDNPDIAKIIGRQRRVIAHFHRETRGADLSPKREYPGRGPRKSSECGQLRLTSE